VRLDPENGYAREVYVLPDKSYLSVGFEPEQMMRLFEVQRTLRIDSKRAILKTVEIMYYLLTDPKLQQLKELSNNPMIGIDQFLKELIDTAYQYNLEEGRLKA